MKAFWDPDTIRFMIDACENGTYNQSLADRIGPRLAPGSHVCDAGCGLGYLSLELVRYARRITAVDVSQDALDVLAQNCRARGLEQVRVCCGRLDQALPDEPYDAMVFCMFGEGEDILHIAKAQCRSDVFAVMRNYPAHRFSITSHRMEYKGYGEMCRLLEGLGIPFDCEEFGLDFGQPFRCLDDARTFFKRYSRDPESLITDEFLAGRLIRTGRDDFPLFMPHEKRLGLVHFAVKDIPPAAVEIG